MKHKHTEPHLLNHLQTPNFFVEARYNSDHTFQFQSAIKFQWHKSKILVTECCISCVKMRLLRREVESQRGSSGNWETKLAVKKYKTTGLTGSVAVPSVAGDGFHSKAIRMGHLRWIGGKILAFKKLFVDSGQSTRTMSQLSSGIHKWAAERIRVIVSATPNLTCIRSFWTLL